MPDRFTENIVLSPAKVKDRQVELTERYHRQAEEAKKRFIDNKEILLGRWKDKERANNIFESFSFIGAVTLSESEYLSLSDSPLKEFVDSPANNYKDGFKYRMSGGGRINMRGESYYQFFDRDQTAQYRLGMTTMSIRDLSGRLHGITEYIGSKPELSVQELKIYLGFLDNLKAELLRVFHAQKHMDVGEKDAPRTQRSYIEETLEAVSETYYNILDGGEPETVKIDQEKLITECNGLGKRIDDKDKRGEKLGGIMRGLPECDNGLFNKIYAIGVARRLKDTGTDNLVLAGMHFGGIELPWAVLQETRRLNLTDPELLTIHYSRYTNLTEEPETFEGITDKKVHSKRRLFILEDGVYSGSSIEAVYRLALKAGFENIDVSVQLLANSRQIGRMLHSGGINPDFVDQMLVDSIGISPFFRTRSVEDYNDIKQKGLFNIIAERVRRMITANFPNNSVFGIDVFAKVRK